jgi:hypothetical protein
MGRATRDYIPEGEEMTPNEYANRNKHAAIRTGANHQDFIPDPESSESLVRPKYTPEERADRAMDAAIARSKAASDADWDIAKTRLAGWNPRQAIEAMTRMPQQVMELYIIAEEDTGHRHDILSVFPTPRQTMYHRYAPHLEVEKFGAYEAPAQVPPAADLAPEAPAELPVEASAVEPPADAEEVFICFDCDHEPFKTVAGLKSHGRAKHGDPEEAESSADEASQASEDVDPQAGVDEE